MGSRAESKLENLKACRRTLDIRGDETDDVREIVMRIGESLERYVRNDRTNNTAQILSVLQTTVEEHGDLEEAVHALDRAIRNTEEDIRQEELEKRRLQAALAEEV